MSSADILATDTHRQPLQHCNAVFAQISLFHPFANWPNLWSSRIVVCPFCFIMYRKYLYLLWNLSHKLKTMHQSCLNIPIQWSSLSVNDSLLKRHTFHQKFWKLKKAKKFSPVTSGYWRPFWKFIFKMFKNLKKKEKKNHFLEDFFQRINLTFTNICIFIFFRG